MYYLSPKLLNWHEGNDVKCLAQDHQFKAEPDHCPALTRLFQLLQAVSWYLYTVTYSLNMIPNYLALPSHTV